MSDTVVFDTPEGIEFFRLASIKSAVKLESKGIRVSSRFSAYATAKKRYGLKGDREKVLAQLEAMVKERIEKKCQSAT